MCQGSAEAVTSTNPVGEAAIIAFELGSSVARDIQARDTGKAVKETVEGATLSTGAFFGVPSLIIGGAVAGATELCYHLLGHSHPNKPPSHFIGGAVTEPGLLLDKMRRTYAESLGGKADAVATTGGLRG